MPPLKIFPEKSVAPAENESRDEILTRFRHLVRRRNADDEGTDSPSQKRSVSFPTYVEMTDQEQQRDDDSRDCVSENYVAMRDPVDGGNSTRRFGNSDLIQKRRRKINFLEDDVKDMTWSRRFAMKSLHKYWYNPNAGKEKKRLELAKEALLRGPETRPPTVAREEIPSLEKAWAYYEHFDLPRYFVEEEQDMNNLQRAEPGENEFPTKLYDPIKTPLNQMGDFGLGFGLYFSTLRAISILTFVAGLLNIPNILFFASKEYSDGQTSVNPLMRGSAICTRTQWVPCVDCQEQDFPEQRFHSYSVSDDDDGDGEYRVSFALKNQCEGATFQQGMINLGTLVLVFIGIQIMHAYQQRMEVAFDEDEQTAQDYSVRIKNPPPDATDPDEWRRFFKESFDADATVVTVALDNDKLINALRERRECLRTLEMQVEPGTSLDHFTLARLSAEAERDRSALARIISKVFPGLPEVFGRKAELEAKIIGWAQLDYPCSNVFVSFETETDQRRVLSALKIGKRHVKRNATQRLDQRHLFRGNLVLAASEPEEPNTIRWHDLNITFTDKLKPLVTTTICSALIILGIALLIRFIHHRSVLFAATAIAMFNVTFPLVAKALTTLERHSTECKTQTSLYFKIAVFRWVNTAIILSVICPFTATLEGGGGEISSVLSIFLADIVTTNMIQLADAWGNTRRHILAPRARTQEDMNIMMRGEEVELAERYTNMTKILFLALWYCSIFPAALFMCSFALFVNYYCDRFSLMRTWKRLPNYGTGISKFSRQFFFPFAIVAMAVISSYFWSGFPFDNLCPYDGELPANFQGFHQFEKDGEVVSLDLSNQEDQTGYRYCFQDMLDFKPPNFPALSLWQPEGDEWMTSEQELVVNIHGMTSVGVIVCVCLFFLYLVYVRLKAYLFAGKYFPVGDDQGINYSEVKSISAYVPQVVSSMYSYPLLACDTRQIDRRNVLDWTDPDRPHSYYDLTLDAEELLAGIEDLEKHMKDKKVFSVLAYYPPPAPPLPPRDASEVATPTQSPRSSHRIV